jgi:DNA-binding PadR family transcriptional regulator
LNLFRKHDFEIGTYSYSWDNRRWNKLLKNGWIVVWRHRNRTTQKYNIYKVSFKGKQLIQRIYRIMLGEDDIPTSERRNKIMKGNTYIDKVLQTSIYNVNKDKNR